MEGSVTHLVGWYTVLLKLSILFYCIDAFSLGEINILEFFRI